MRTVRPVAVLGGVRIPFCRQNTAYADVGNLGMSVRTLGALVEKFGLHGQPLGEVAMGAVIKHSADWNLAREAALSSGLSPLTPGITLQRACGTSLDSIITVANKIAVGQIESGIGGGSDTTSDVPIVYGKALRGRLLRAAAMKTPRDKLMAFRGFHPRELKPDFPGVAEPRTGKSMGAHCEDMAKEWNISRDSQDEWALGSHRRLVVRDGVVVAATLVGDLSRVGLITQHFDRRTVLGPSEPGALLMPDRPPPSHVLAADAEVCACAGVTATEIRRCTSLAEVRETTRATTGCGGCADTVRQLLAPRTTPTLEGIPT